MDALTYAGNTANIADLLDHERLAFVEGDIRDAAHVEEIVAGVDVIVNAAAESHVEKSILDGASEFVTTNVEGTQVLLDACRARIPSSASSWSRRARSTAPPSAIRWTRSTRSTRARRTRPRRPAATASSTATGAPTASPAVVVRPFNNYGPYQHPEKVIPRFITAALQDRPLTVHGGGSASRDWLHVEDTSRGDRRASSTRRSSASRARSLNVATGRRRRRAEHRRAHLRQPRQAALADPPTSPDRPGQVDRHIGSTDKAAELRRLARAHRLRRGPRAHDPLVRATTRPGGRRTPCAPFAPDGLGCYSRRRAASSCSVPGPAQFGAYAAARRLGVETIACDRDPGVLRARGARRPLRADLDDGRRRRASAGARAHAPAELIAPGTDGPVRVAAEVAAALGLPHPARPRTAAALRPTSASSGAALRPRRRAAARPGARTAGAAAERPASSSSRSVAQGQRGLEIVEPRRRPRRRALRARAGRLADGEALCEEFVDGAELTVNAFLDDGRFVPLTVTDRERALAFGVATAHLFPSHARIADVGRGGRGRLRGARRRARPDLHAGRCSHPTGRG